MRGKIAFLQSAVRAGIPWPKVVLGTISHFGSRLKPPFEAVSEPLPVPAYQPPSFDISRQTSTSWKQQADAGWEQYRNDIAKAIHAQIDDLVKSGQLKTFDRPRISKSASSHESIIDERTALAMAAKNFLLGTTFADLAREYPPKDGYHGKVPEKAKQKKKRANQIRMRVTLHLKRLGLPTAP